MEPNPDISWYLAVSKEREVSPRCPFTSVEKCPRYYASLSMLEHLGHTSIDAEEDKRLLAFWKASDLWPRIAETDTSVSGSGPHQCLSNFCPEVIYERFGHFAAMLVNHGDEIDRDAAYSRLNTENVPRTSWKWQWAHLQPMHFTECPLYSPLIFRKDKEAPQDIAPLAEATGIKPRSNKIFLVHGHEGEPREAVARFLERIGLKPIVLQEQANRGHTIIEKVEAHGDVSFAIVLLTPDDQGGKVGEPLKPRVRQNVLLELGYFVGRLGRRHVCALKCGEIEVP